MTLTSEKTIREIAAESPAAIPVLEKYGVDYCCGGARTIEAAAEESGVPVEILLKEIDGAAVTSRADLRDWRSASLGELVQHILEKHHAYLRNELPSARRVRNLSRIVPEAGGLGGGYAHAYSLGKQHIVPACHGAGEEIVMPLRNLPQNRVVVLAVSPFKEDHDSLGSAVLAFQLGAPLGNEYSRSAGLP